MTIAIDASRAVNESAGIGRYTKELVEHLLKVGKDHKFILIFTYWRADEKKEEIIKKFRQGNVTIRTAKIPGALKETLWRGKSRLYNFLSRKFPRQAMLGYNGLYQGAEVVLAPSFLEYKNGLKLPQVTVIHDMATFLFPDQRGKEVSNRLSNQASIAIKGSKKVIAVSKNTKKDIEKLTKASGDKLRVIYPGLTGFDKIAPNLPKGLLAKKYILFTGTIEPRKNLKNLLIAYSLQPTTIKKKYPLVICGASGWNNVEELRVMDEIESVKWLGFVSDEILAKLYKDAAVFVYPSLYEGFGLPILEAMQAGVPVITSNRSSTLEVAGTAGCLINPDDPKSIAGGLQAVLEGKISRCQMVKTGREQVKKFSWEKCALEVLEVLKN